MKALRAYKTQKQREYRAKISGNKKRAVRQKDRDYRRNKRAAAHVSKAPPKKRETREERHMRRLKESDPKEFAEAVSNFIVCHPK
jgi:hypothetical protein